MRLLELVKIKDLEGVKSLLSQNPSDADSADEMGITALQLASTDGTTLILEEILKARPSNIDQANMIGLTAFRWAFNGGHRIAMKLLVEAGADINQLDTSNETCLHRTIYDNKLDEAQYLLELGANCKILSYGNETPLHAVRNQIKNPGIAVQWWTALFDYGAGLFHDFSNLEINPEFLSIVTENQIFIGAREDGKSIERKTPGFEKAITTIPELKNAIANGNIYMFKQLHNMAQYLLKKHENNSEAAQVLYELSEVLKPYTIPTAVMKMVDKILIHGTFKEDKKPTLPPDLQEKLAIRNKQWELQVTRGGKLNYHQN